MGIERRRASRDPQPVDPNGIKVAPQPDHHRPDATIAHNQVGADTDRKHRNGGIEVVQEALQVLKIGGLKQPIRRATNPQPGEVVKRAVGGQGATGGGEFGLHGLVGSAGSGRGARGMGVG